MLQKWKQRDIIIIINNNNNNNNKIPPRTTINYSAIADLHTLLFTITHTLVFSVFTSCILATDLWQSDCHCSTHEVFFSQPDSFLVVSSQSFDCGLQGLSRFWTNCSLGTPELDSLFSTELFFITTLHGPNRKHRFQQYPLLRVYRSIT
jgi:hypothetical protein